MEPKRFEFSDGSSNKFWQIARDGAALLVTFGKIGTAGQAQRKELASEAAAIAEHDKLVKEKTKKGYVAVATDAAPAGPAPVPKVKAPKADAPAPKPATAAPAEVATPAETPPTPTPTPARQGDYVLEERYVGEGFQASDGSWSALAARWFAPGLRDANEHIALLTAGRKETLAKLRPAVDQVIALLGSGGEGALDVPAAAILLRLGPDAVVTPYLVARLGLAAAVEAYEAAHGLSVDSDGKATSIKDEGHYLLPDSARALLACEARVEPSAWTAALATLRAARLAETSRARRAEYNIVLRDEAFVAEDLELNRPNPDWQVTRFMFLATRDPEVQKVLAPGVDAALAFEVVGVAAQAWILPKIEKDNWLVETLFDLETVPAAKCIANDLTNKRTHERVREYYAKRPDLALRALVPIVVGAGKLAAFAKPIVEATIAAHPALPAIVAPLVDAKSRAFLTAEKKPALPDAAPDAVPEALRRDPAPGVDGFPKKLAPLPEFATAALAAAPVRLRGTSTVLPASAMARLCQALRYAKGSPAITSAKAASEPKDLAAFAWELFERWQAAGAPNKEPWGFTALGLLGDDDTARSLTPLIRAWPGESLHARATVGLDVLATLGTDVALMNLHGIAQKLKFKALQEKAREKIAEVAAARGFTAEELADRLVPDFDLGDEGGDVLDFGPRAFTISFDESLKPRLKGPDGKVMGDLPKPGKSDDAEKATAATERWKALKKDAKLVASGLLLRLELAMCDERRWKTDVFRTFIVEHPLVVHLARRLVWGVYDAKGKLQATFRVAEDGTLSDDRDAAFTLAPDATVGLVHKLGLDAATLARWSAVFGDYELLQPFDQLARQTFTPTPKEVEGKCVERLAGVEVKTSRLLGLEARGWRKGAAQDGGWVWDLWRPLGGGIVAELGLEGGLCMGLAELNPATQKVGAIHFHKDKNGQREDVPLSALSPIVFSELAREQELLRE
ncbi:MAG TPA: DUF4132 domain-containing protein [Polyangiaceae bacterium]|nr:DUF4132 domain-containing protein [Polyangiaceae bacterium]